MSRRCLELLETVLEPGELLYPNGTVVPTKKHPLRTKKTGRPTLSKNKKPTDIFFSVRVPEELELQIRQLCREYNITLSSFTRTAIETYIKNFHRRMKRPSSETK